MRLSLCQFITQECSYCNGTIAEHESGCPEGIIENLFSQRRNLECPNCGKKEVEVNVDDFYECRNCHTQYVTTDWNGSWERAFIIDMNASIAGAAINVQVHPVKGKGKFKLDRDIAVQAARKVRMDKKR